MVSLASYVSSVSAGSSTPHTSRGCNRCSSVDRAPVCCALASYVSSVSAGSSTPHTSRGCNRCYNKLGVKCFYRLYFIKFVNRLMFELFLGFVILFRSVSSVSTGLSSAKATDRLISYYNNNYYETRHMSDRNRRFGASCAIIKVT